MNLNKNILYHYEKILFIGGHIDDEIFIINHLLQLIKLDKNIKFIWSTLPCDKATRKKRIQEANRAFSLINKPLKKQYLLGYPDRKSFLFSLDITDDLIFIINDFKPEAIIIPAYEAGNIDHDTIHICAVKAAKYLTFPINHIYEYPIYNSTHTKHWFSPISYKTFTQNFKDTYHLKTSPENKAIILSYYHCYKDQQDIIFNAKYTDNKSDFFNSESIRKLAPHNYNKRPTRELSYEQYQNISYHDFNKIIQKIDYHLGINKNKIIGFSNFERKHLLSHYERHRWRAYITAFINHLF